MRSCPSCGGDVPEGAAFCPQCGTPSATHEAGADDPTRTEAPAANPRTTSPSNWTPPAPAPAADPDPPASDADDRTRVDIPVNDPTAILPQSGLRTDGPPPPPPPAWSNPAPTAPPPTPPPFQQWSAAPAAPPTWSPAPGGPQGGFPPLPAPGRPPEAGGTPFAPPGAAPAPRRRKRRSIVGGVLGIIGGAGAITATFLDWIEVTFPDGAKATAKGFDATDDARIALGIGIAAVVVGLSLFASRFILLRLALVAAGAGVIAIFVRDLLDASQLRDALGADSFTTGIGLYVLAGSGAVMIIGGLASFLGGGGRR